MRINEIDHLLAIFPKKRPTLSKAYRKIYHEHYQNNRSHIGIVNNIAHFLESWMHIRVAKDIKNPDKPYSTLEIGAGTLNHLAYENPCQAYDVVEPYKELYKKNEARRQVRKFFNDIREVSGCYDRIISIATFEHLSNLPLVIAKCGLLLKDGGTLRVAIPAEGNLIWKLAYTFSTGLAFYFKYKLRYELLMRYEHINSWQEIGLLLNYFFRKVDNWYFGISSRVSLYHFYQCREPLRERCLQFTIR